jgi:hypothetical protein
MGPEVVLDMAPVLLEQVPRVLEKYLIVLRK